MKTTLCIILSIFLTGCACFKKPEVIIPPERVVNIDPKLLQLCPLLDVDVTVPSFTDAITEYASITTKYAICANKQSDSVKIIKQFGNIE